MSEPRIIWVFIGFILVLCAAIVVGSVIDSPTPNPMLNYRSGSEPIRVRDLCNIMEHGTEAQINSMYRAYYKTNPVRGCSLFYRGDSIRCVAYTMRIDPTRTDSVWFVTTQDSTWWEVII